MSQMPPFLRAYRQALRDVQRAVLLHAHSLSCPFSTWSAVINAADWVSVPLGKFRETGMRSLDPDIRERMASASSDQIAFVTGYLAGFDKAVDIVANHGRKMNNPDAGDAIRETVLRLQQVRAQMGPHESGTITTLRARKFMI